MSKPTQPYEVGYKKPPAATQFKKGQSGNPSGKKKPKTLADALRTQLGREVSIKGAAGSEKRTVAELLITRLIKKALDGDHASLKLVLDSARTLGQDAAEQAPPLTDHEIQQLKDLLAGT